MKSNFSPLLQRRYILFIVALLCLGGGVFFLSQEQSSIVNFRTCQDLLKPSRFSPSLVGLRELNASASGRLSKAKIEKYFKRLPKKVYVIDVRAEEDFYIKGISAGWLGIRYFDGTVEDRFYKLSFLETPFHHLKWMWRRLINLGSLSTPALQQLQSEQLFLKNLGHDYYCFAGHRHMVHSNEMIQSFLSFLETLPNDAWLHFHCATGRGRSTTFMILYDIYHNSKKVGLEDIILRQHLLGGENVLDVALRPKGTWSRDSLLKRKALVENFYAYMNDPQGYGSQSWMSWTQKNSL
jgi:hypothetical protein